ncbi:translation initiation factor IF-2-like isoform X1 [Panicum virgatum]|uniref:translation initiation factor IF-2-like isoform X1 n=1 Tax=Panicum virgatum TaxID=38727 RepID=UPI0019D53EDC|nr:translation initiation factor IF-2-like isoform X1 [Panicum virgatum]
MTTPRAELSRDRLLPDRARPRLLPCRLPTHGWVVVAGGGSPTRGPAPLQRRNPGPPRPRRRRAQADPPRRASPGARADLGSGSAPPSSALELGRLRSLPPSPASSARPSLPTPSSAAAGEPHHPTPPTRSPWPPMLLLPPGRGLAAARFGGGARRRPLARRPGQAAARGGAVPSQRTRGGRACWALLCSGGRGAQLHVQPPCERGGRALRGAQAAAASGGRGGGQPMAARLAAEWWPRPRRYFAVENKVLLSHIELCLEDTSTTGLLELASSIHVRH